MKAIRRPLRAFFMALEAAFDRAFGPAQNPLSHLGALGFFFYWIVVATGIHLYVGFDTAAGGAYESVEHLSRSAWFLGGVSRSLALDNYGKALASAVLRFEVEIPDALAPLLRGPAQ